MNDDDLQRMAVKELLQEAKRGKERYKTMGPSGWQKDLIPSTNKQFLQRTIASSLFRSKQVKDDKRKNTNKSSNNQPKSILLPIADDKSKEVKKELKSNDKSVLKSNKRKQNVSNDCIISSKKTK